MFLPGFNECYQFPTKSPISHHESSLFSDQKMTLRFCARNGSSKPKHQSKASLARVITILTKKQVQANVNIKSACKKNTIDMKTYMNFHSLHQLSINFPKNHPLTRPFQKALITSKKKKTTPKPPNLTSSVYLPPQTNPKKPLQTALLTEWQSCP